MVFEHDGALFTSDELAALLSGGSSEEFESAVTTGRFGTGFLVTYVLDERTNLRGLLEVPTGCEQFNLTLHRGGDEDAILENIRSCNKTMRAAELVTDSDTIPSASFEYPIVDGTSRARDLGDMKTLNMFMLGCASLFVPLKVHIWKDCTSQRLASKMLQVNMIAFHQGRKEIRGVYL
ncbi:hypothetical protein ACFLU8_04090 [Chloroflexota bacterium]